ncbi:MAG: hypothetical protein M3460_03120 [Actinomycetota bacterium]|nr:hypothetical protein [Actinomycetota bacterium]
MSGTDEHPLLRVRGSSRILMRSTFVLAAAAAAVLVLGTQDAHLLRLGLVAALWAALLGAFAAARIRREISSCADRADQLRTVYQLQLEREVTARREHALTIERELREQAEVSQRREIVELRGELAAMRANLERLLGGDRLERPVTTTAAVKAIPSLSDPELCFGPGSPPMPAWEATPSLTDSWASNGGIANEQGRHNASSREWPGSNGNGSHHNGSHHNGSHHNGSHHNGSHHNGGSARWEADGMPTAAAQRTVNDLLAAHGIASVPRRRRSHEDTTATSG